MSEAPEAPASARTKAPKPVAAVHASGFWAVIAAALAQRIAAPARGHQSGGTSLLDFILVVGALVLVGGGLYGLFTIKEIPDKTLPIIASILSFVCGSILGAYAGYRWGASVATRQAAPPPATPAK